MFLGALLKPLARVDLAESVVEGDGQAGPGGDGLGGLPRPRHRARVEAAQPHGGQPLREQLRLPDAELGQTIPGVV